MVLFVLGFLFYSLLYAALGSLVSRQEDVQSATSPLMVLIMAGYFMSIFGIQIDQRDLGQGGLVRAVLQPVPDAGARLGRPRRALGVRLSVALLAAAIGVALVAAARIYSAGVLLYGQRVGLRQVFRAARVSR